MSKKFILGLIFIILLASSVYALGVTPGRTTIDFSPNLEQTVSFSVINSEHKDMNLVIFAQGELNQSISIKENTLKIGASEESKQLSYDIKLPSSLSPGVHIGEVVILQLPEKAKESEAYVGAAIAVVTQLYVYVPYPGKYAEADMNIINAEQGEEATFIIPVVNRGNLDLVSVKANVDVYNKLNEKISSFNTQEISLASGEKTDIVTKWKADFPVGTYRAVATLIYDENTLQLEKQFNIGSAVLDLQQIDVKDFTLGQIAKFEMLIENKWSEPIKGAYAETQVFDKDRQVMADFKTPTYDIEPFKKVDMISYWDTGGVKVGTYDASVFLRYGEKSTQKDLQFKVAEDKIDIIGLGYVISERKSSSGGSSNLVTILAIAIGVLILINALWFLALRKYLKKKT